MTDGDVGDVENSPDPDPTRRIRAAVLDEALATAHALAPADGASLLVEVADYVGRHLGFARGMAVARGMADPWQRAAAVAKLALMVLADDESAEAGRALGAALDEALARGGHPPAAEFDASEALRALAALGDFRRVERLAARAGDERAAHAVIVRALLREGRVRDAAARVASARAGEIADDAVGDVAHELAANGDGAAALELVERIDDGFDRERWRLDVLHACARAGAAQGEAEEPGGEGAGDRSMRAARCTLSALHALDDMVRQCLQAHDADAARTLATAAARLADRSVESRFRDRALELAVRLRCDVGDGRGALATARLLPSGSPRESAVLDAFRRLAEDGCVTGAAVARDEVFALADDDDERERAAAALASSALERGMVAEAVRWLALVRSATLREDVLMDADAQGLRDHLAAAGARVPAAADVAPTPGEELARVVEVLRAGDGPAAARALESMPRDAGWAAWCVGGLAARHGQAHQLREWARAHLAPAMRIRALLGVAAWAGTAPRDDDAPAPPFPRAS